MSFNPRARVGRDPRCGFEFNDSGVSIHAPAWGATNAAITRSSVSFRFNPRARVGRDTFFNSITSVYLMFQSTRPRGARPYTPQYEAKLFVGFNPRARVGRDARQSDKRREYRKFQSTRPRGARRECGDVYEHCKQVSIHAPAWGATSMEYQSKR